jgi:uncharacterized protein YqjF (DUF2071 family)
MKSGMNPLDDPAQPPPSGPWVMVQRWHDLLFAHWRCPVSDLRPLIPQALEIDAFDGDAWIGVVPFYMRGVRMRLTPPLPTVHAFQELNVRTYVSLDGKPGVWFFSLDCESSLAVIGARIGAHLPYFRAAMQMRESGGTIEYRSRRWSIAGPPALFAATYRGLGDPFTAAPGTRDHFLTERYCLYASDGKRIWRGDISHPRWSLQCGEARMESNSMLAAAGVRAIDHDPVLHFSSFQDVRLWWPRRVR